MDASTPTGPHALRAERLRHLGAPEADLDALVAYTASPFDLSGPLVLEDEPFVEVWESYLERAAEDGVFSALRSALVQLRFPVRAGMSAEPAYRLATRRGDLSGLLGPTFDGGLALVAPERIRLALHPTPAGRLPVITLPERADFEAFVQALTRKNEPAPLPPSMGALLVSGYNNWDRVRRYREAWEREAPPGETWKDAFARLVPQPSRYRDRFVLLSEGPYSAVPAREVGLGPEAWQQLSHAIRLEHECAHYYCKRALGAMRYHVADEVVADAYALAVAAGGFRPDWALRFLGIEPGESLPKPGGRMWTYCDGLSEGAVRTVVSLVRGWAAAVPSGVPASPPERAAFVRTLAGIVAEVGRPGGCP